MLEKLLTVASILVFGFAFGSIVGAYQKRRNKAIATKDIKMKWLLIDVYNDIEKDPAPPTMDQLEDDMNNFLEAVDGNNTSIKTTTGKKLIASLLKWQVENL